MERTQRASVLLLCTVLLVVLPMTSAKVSSLWVFGDDYVDLGTGSYVPELLRKCTMDPYGELQDTPTGRCSNGNILTDQLAKQMGTVIGPFAGPEAFQVNGVSFAAAGSGALPETNSKGSIPLETQLQQFQGLIKKKGWENKLNESLVMISFGMNDYLEAVFAGQDPMAYVEKVITKIINLVKSIHAISGAYRFVIISVPPLGCLPLVRQRFFAPPEKCLTNVNAVNEQHEQRLMYALDALVSMQPQEEPLFYSMFLLSVAFQDSAMGFPAFTKGWEVACGIVDEKGAPVNCGQNVSYVEDGEQKTAPVMAPKMSGYDYFWWDFLNPTENAFYTLWVGMWMGSNPKAVYPYSVLKLTFT